MANQSKNTRFKAKPKMNEIRKAKGINGKELAALAGVTEPTISRFDSQSRYDIDVLVSVSKALGVTIEELFEINEHKEEDGQ
ncbi:helix-turn-helix transcriptional regulator [Peribacillus simplex]|uniref:helix-turn-helix domain-containing protein n=1 Tax=Peribacillus simplex TaxID=1478 RepID=UPI002E1EA587|nr:helix-turn-helix transcriptional regulator [Peribacillus simplex]